VVESAAEIRVPAFPLCDGQRQVNGKRVVLPKRMPVRFLAALLNALSGGF
jgi:hypothetical protein